MDAVLEQFLSEAKENLDFLDKNLKNLENENQEELDALFRAAHTLKGGAGLVGLESIKIITHYAEDLLDGIKKQKIKYTQDMLEVLYDAFDEIVEMIDSTQDAGELISFDDKRVSEIANKVKALIGNEKEDNLQKLDTELNIITSEKINIAELIPLHNLDSYLKELPFSMPIINQEFIEEDNFYLIDFDLDEECCNLGNDPIYLSSLLGENAIFSINTIIYETNDLKKIANLWKTRLLMVVKSSKDMLEDCFYNILDDITFYPLSIKSLFEPSFDSLKDEQFECFVKELRVFINSNDYINFDKKLSETTKKLDFYTKEGFILSRLETLLPYFEFEGIDYLELINFVSILLKIDNPSLLQNKENSSSEFEKQTVLNTLKQQLKVLEFSKDDMTLSRVRLHSKNSLEFISIESNLHIDDSKEDLVKKIDNYILILEKDLSISESTNSNENIDNKLLVEEKELVKEDFIINENQKQKSIIPKTVKINQSDIDDMMNIIGELLVMKNSLPYISSFMSSENVVESKTQLNTKYEEINRVTEKLQELVMGMRLLPLSYIFSRYPKLIRELSKKLDKKIKFEEYGSDTKLDKMMIEKIADPLVHIIRNSIDHGIEQNYKERVELGKTKEGLIRIGAKSVGDKVQIIIEDDGRGIDTQKVLIKALELGLTTEEKIELMSEQEKLQMIFNPGLSTATQITDISGRGVGADAVKKTIEELSGEIYLESSLGLGTKVTIEIPVSVALSNVFCIKMNNINYAIAMENVIETIKISTSDIQMANKKPYARLRGELIPLVFEKRLLPKNQKNQKTQSVVIVQANSLKYGLVVNELVNQLDVVQKPLEGVLSSHPIITGTSLLGNGEILFTLDVNNIID
ncbi:chemotaxis protein CheW [Malaciobacter canalis]|uniref:chemotaxis protein CheA n=1 Tax=Malaciobacter canalis TaxID=1912871 RepID=UPI003850439D